MTQDRSALAIRGELMFLEKRAVIRVLGINGRGLHGTVGRIVDDGAGLDGAEPLRPLPSPPLCDGSHAAPARRPWWRRWQ